MLVRDLIVPKLSLSGVCKSPGADAYIKDTRVRFRLNAFSVSALSNFHLLRPLTFPSLISRAKSITMSQSDASHTEGISDIVSGLPNNFSGDLLGWKKEKFISCQIIPHILLLFYHPKEASGGWILAYLLKCNKMHQQRKVVVENFGFSDFFTLFFIDFY